VADVDSLRTVLTHYEKSSSIKLEKQTMSDVYYIIVTVIFGVFVLVMAVWIWRYMRASNPLELTHEELSDDQKALIYKFCGEMRRAREAKERATMSIEPTTGSSRMKRKPKSEPSA